MEHETRPIEEPSDNGGDLWAAWGKTPPSHTKKVKLGDGTRARTFTSVDAYWQIEKANELFGACGYGWGWTEPQFDILFPDKVEHTTLTVRFTLWAFWGAGELRLHMYNAQKLFSKSGYLDADTWKKLLTDTITKGLSYWGSAADIFQGKYDDSRYVQDMLAEEAAQTARAPVVPPATPARTVGTVYNEFVTEFAAHGMSAEDLREYLRERCGITTLQGVTPAALETILAGWKADPQP